MTTSSKKPDVRKALLCELEEIKSSHVALLLSGGIDSLVCLFALQELGKEVTAYSFMLDGKLSTDFSMARARARQFDVNFIPIFLPRDVSELQRDLIGLASIGAKKKTDFECAWPVYRAFREIKEGVIVSGHGADGHFCISKKGMIHWRDRIDEFRAPLFAPGSGYSQRPILERHADLLGKQFEAPFFSRAMIKEFEGTTWDEINKPKQKMPILLAYPQFQKTAIKPHSNLHMGDTGIAEHFNLLLKTSWNRRRSRSPVAIYNDLASGAIRDL